MTSRSPRPDGPADVLRRLIGQKGTIGFDEFMAVALYHPTGGYYASPANRIGRGGDFFTSVSVGPVFGKLLAAQFLEMKERLGHPVDFTLVEQGANDGQLLADILAAWEGDTPHIVIIEPLESRRDVQQAALAPWASRVTHIASEEELPSFTGVFFANELLDAFPFRIFVRRHKEWLERRVASTEGRFIFVDEATGRAPAGVDLPSDIPEFVLEVRTSLPRWIRCVADRLQRGWMLLVDYGHPATARHHPARAGGTLACYRGHLRAGDPLADPGGQDLTAHVDFTAVARAAEQAGLSLAGFTDQHHSLAALAAKVFPAMPATELSPDAAREMRGLRQLLHPESMGTSFKFLALAKNTAAALTSFAFARDPRRELFP